MSKSKVSDRSSYPRIVIAGAGNIGCFVGAMLVRGGCNAAFLMRPYLQDEILHQGLTISDFHGLEVDLSPDLLQISTDPKILRSADIILVTVKSHATQKMAHLIADHAAKTTTVISLQNGLSNAKILRDTLRGWDVRSGMVPFNVVYRGAGWFHRGTSGDILISNGAGHIARELSVVDMHVHERKALTSYQWGKFLFNLNNALNALSGLSIREQLSHTGWRLLAADQIAEALKVFNATGIEAWAPVPVPVKYLPFILRLPTFLFHRVASAMLTIDPQAKSSMAEDLLRGRQTEIDELQGLIVELGRQHEIPTPVNARVAELIRTAERNQSASPALTPKQVRTGLFSMGKIKIAA